MIIELLTDLITIMVSNKEAVVPFEARLLPVFAEILDPRNLEANPGLIAVNSYLCT
jgi:hypothetical protein